MSKFKTSIAVDVEAIKKLLPDGAFIHGVEWDEVEGDVNILWEHEKLVTGRDFPIEFPITNLEVKKLPKGIEMLRSSGPRSTRPKAPAAAPPLSEVDIEAREFEAGKKLALDGGAVTACESEAARRGFESVSNPAGQGNGEPESVTNGNTSAPAPVIPPVTATGPESAAPAPTAEVVPAPTGAAPAPVAAPQPAVATTTAKAVAKKKNAR